MGRYKDGSIDFDPFDDDYRGFDMRDSDPNRGPLIFALAIGVLLVFGAVIWNTYRQGVRQDGAVPMVVADKQPYKSVPAETGGKVVPDTDKRFFDQIDGSERPATPETDDVSGQVLQGGPPIDIRPNGRALQEDVDPDNGMPNAVADQVKALADIEGTPSDNSGVEVAATKRVAVKPAAARPVPSARKSMYAFDSSGKYLIQVAAFRKETAAESTWKKLKIKAPNLYEGAGKYVQRADLGAKGVFYRLRIGKFSDRDEARKFCDAVKKTGDNCILVTDE